MTHSVKRKWTFDLSGSTSTAAHKIPEPYGYVSATVQRVNERREDRTSELRTKRAWELAKSPMSMIPLYGLLFFLLPNAPSIYTLSFTFIALSNPITQAVSVLKVFAGLSDKSNSSQVILCQIIYVLGNMFFAGLALWKISKMGLLPVHDADWIAFYGVPQPTDMVTTPL